VLAISLSSPSSNSPNEGAVVMRRFFRFCGWLLGQYPVPHWLISSFPLELVLNPSAVGANRY